MSGARDRETTGSALDPTALERLRRLGGEPLAQRMAALFVDLGRERVASARAGIEAGDAEAVERAAHSLKSSAGNVGAATLQEAATRAEEAAEAARAGRSGEVPLAELVARMADAFEAARRALEE